MSLVRVAQYLATDEARDWNESDRPANHIYLDVVRLQQFIEKNEPKR